MSQNTTQTSGTIYGASAPSGTTLTGALTGLNLNLATNYTAEVEAMRAGKLDVGEFGPLGYIFAHQLAKAQPVAVFCTNQTTVWSFAPRSQAV